MKELNEDGMETQDGEVVRLYDGTFKGTWVEEFEEAVTRSSGDVGVALVTYRIDTPKFAHIKKTGELKRTNSFMVEDVRHIDRDKAAMLFDSLGQKVNGINDGLVTTSNVEDSAQSALDLESAMNL